MQINVLECIEIFINVPKLEARIVTPPLTNLKGNATKVYTGVSKLLHLVKKVAHVLLRPQVELCDQLPQVP